MSQQYLPLHQNILQSFETMKKIVEPAIGKIDLGEPAYFGEIPPTDCLMGVEEPQGESAA
jgi:hypothetical protein